MKPFLKSKNLENFLTIRRLIQFLKIKFQIDPLAHVSAIERHLVAKGYGFPLNDNASGSGSEDINSDTDDEATPDTHTVSFTIPVFNFFKKIVFGMKLEEFFVINIILQNGVSGITKVKIPCLIFRVLNTIFAKMVYKVGTIKF